MLQADHGILTQMDENNDTCRDDIDKSNNKIFLIISKMKILF